MDDAVGAVGGTKADDVVEVRRKVRAERGILAMMVF